MSGTMLRWHCHKHMMACVGPCPVCKLEKEQAVPDHAYSAEHRVAPPAVANERGSGLKFDGDKSRWSLLMGGMPKALAGVAAVLTFGAKKYAAHSWKQVENNKERYRDALYRHLNQLEAGELVDAESGLSHWDHIACNALFLSELSKDQA